MKIFSFFVCGILCVRNHWIEKKHKYLKREEKNLSKSSVCDVENAQDRHEWFGEHNYLGAVALVVIVRIRRISRAIGDCIGVLEILCD